MAIGVPGEVGQVAQQVVVEELKVDHDCVTIHRQLMVALPVLARRLKALPATHNLVQHLEV
jgi:hypothetical protein